MPQICYYIKSHLVRYIHCKVGILNTAWNTTMTNVLLCMTLCISNAFTDLQLVAVERVVFDTLGQMWGTLLINCMTALCSLVGIAGVCIHEKIAIGLVSLQKTLLATMKQFNFTTTMFKCSQVRQTVALLDNNVCMNLFNNQTRWLLYTCK